MAPRETNGRYRFITTRHIRFQIPGIIPRGKITFHDATRIQWLQIDPFGILLSEGYAWNGCTPKRWLPLIGWIGTPDFSATIIASALHDPLYQFHATRHFPLHRSDCDLLFKQAIQLGGEHELAAIYHAGVQKFGHWSPSSPHGEYSLFTP